MTKTFAERFIERIETLKAEGKPIAPIFEVMYKNMKNATKKEE